jgi:ubiquinol-cytochrome c reductase cytochrome c subunit
MNHKEHKVHKGSDHLVRLVYALAVVLLSGTSVLAQAGQSTSAPAGNADAGRQVFQKKGCFACHGREGQGSPTTGPRLGPNPTPFAAFTRYVRTPRGQMPPYTEKVLPDSEMADMYAFLQARPRPASIDTLLQPVLQQPARR